MLSSSKQTCKNSSKETTPSPLRSIFWKKKYLVLKILKFLTFLFCKILHNIWMKSKVKMNVVKDQSKRIKTSYKEKKGGQQVNSNEISVKEQL